MSTTRDWIPHLVLRGLTNPKFKGLNEKIIPYLKQGHFTGSYLLAFNRVVFLYSKKSRIITWAELCNDTSLPEKVRDRLRQTEIKRSRLSESDTSLLLPKTLEEYNNHIETLTTFAEQRQLIEIQNFLTEKLGHKLTREQITDLKNESIKKLEDVSKLSTSDRILYQMHPDETKQTILDLGTKLKSNFFIPTGFKGFDKDNLGIPKDSFFLISGKTGSGKTSLALQLAINMKELGARVCYLPLEMSVEQMLLKLSSNLIKVPTNELVRDFDTHRKTMYKALKDFYARGEEDCSCLHFYVPDIDDTLVDCLTHLKPFKYDVIFGDYLGLFKPIEAASESRSYDLAGRYAKVYATNNSTCVVLLAQFDDEANRVRYSRALVEHAANAWLWHENKDDIKETGYITIRQKKARGQKDTPFKLKADLSISNFIDYRDEYDDDDEVNMQTKEKKTRKNDDLPNEGDV